MPLSAATSVAPKRSIILASKLPTHDWIEAERNFVAQAQLGAKDPVRIAYDPADMQGAIAPGSLPAGKVSKSITLGGTDGYRQLCLAFAAGLSGQKLKNPPDGGATSDSHCSDSANRGNCSLSCESNLGGDWPHSLVDDGGSR
jgi:hypothetical protein